MVYRASTCPSRFKSPKSFVTNSYVVSCRMELARFGSNPVYGNGGTSGSPDSALLHLPGAPRADYLDSVDRLHSSTTLNSMAQQLPA